MRIEISKEDADYIWTTMGLREETPVKSNDECWLDDNHFYDIRLFDDLAIMVVYNVIDPNAEMDTPDFADWDNPAQLLIISDGDTYRGE